MAELQDKLVNYSGAELLYNDLRERAESVVEVSATEPTSENNKLWIDSDAPTGQQTVPTVSEMNAAITVTDVTMDGTSIVSSKVAAIPVATNNTFGVTKPNLGAGIGVDSVNRHLYVVRASDNQIKQAQSIYCPIVPSSQHVSVFYGLATLAGDNTQASSGNAFGTYTAGAKTAIKSMLDISDPTVSDVQVNGTSVVSNGVASIPNADSNNYGTVKLGAGLTLNLENKLCTNPAGTATIKAGANTNQVISPYTQHTSVFYGLAKLAGQDMASSSNAVGTYTDAAKTAIKSMLGISEGVEVVRLI